MSKHVAGLAETISLYYKRLSELICHIAEQAKGVREGSTVEDIWACERRGTGVGADCIISGFMICTARQISFG